MIVDENHFLCSHQLDCVKVCLLIGESSKANRGGITADVERNTGVVNNGGVEDAEDDMGGKEREEMGAIYLLSNLDSPSALAWALLQPLSPLLR